MSEINDDELAAVLIDLEEQMPEASRELVVFDLDKTLVANEDWGNGRYMSDEELRKAKSHRSILRELKTQLRRPLVDVIILTGRKEDQRSPTKDWLARRGLSALPLYMRKESTPVAYVNAYKARTISKLVREGGYSSVVQYDDSKGVLTLVGRTLSAQNIPYKAMLCARGNCKER